MGSEGRMGLSKLTFQRFMPEITGVAPLVTAHSFGGRVFSTQCEPIKCKMVTYHQNEHVKNFAGVPIPLDTRELHLGKKAVRKAHEFTCDHLNLHKKSDVQLIKVLFSKEMFANRIWEIGKSNHPSITYCVHIIGDRKLTERTNAGRFTYFVESENVISMVNKINCWTKYSLVMPNSITAEHRSDVLLRAFIHSESICSLKCSDMERKNSREFKKIA
jgi:hypothetical protein